MTALIAHDAPSEIVIDRIPAPSQTEFERRYLRASQPAVFTNVVPRWKAWQRWSHEYFRRAWGEHQVPVLPTRGRHGQYDTRKGYVFPEMRMAEALDRVEQGGQESVYVMVVVVTLEPGEMFFLPSRRWHHSRSVEPSETITFWEDA